MDEDHENGLLNENSSEASDPVDPGEDTPEEDIATDQPSEESLPDDAPERFRRLIAGEVEPASPDSSPDLDPESDHSPSDFVVPTPTWESQEIEVDSQGKPGLKPEEEVETTPPPDRETLPLPSISPLDLPLDQADFALPQRVPENDMSATTVSPTAYITPSATLPPQEEVSTTFKEWWTGCSGCLLRMVILGLFGFIALVIGVVSLGLYQYYSLAANLPSVDDLRSHAAQFETTRIFDREGNLLYEILDPQAGRRTYVPIEEVSPYLVAAVIATEDAQFYSHPGYDLLAIARAVVQNYQRGEVVTGASTITQQIARILLFTPEERALRTARRKTREVLVAAEVTRRYTKDEILELYLNQIYFGNLAYGVEAAAETYFGTTSDKLTLAQASFLAGLIQAPSVYDVFTNREVTLSRQQQILALMMQTSAEQGCIFVSNSLQAICVSPEDAGRAAAELTNYQFNSPDVQIRFPHWVNYIRSELERLYDPQTIYRSGFNVHTTLDPFLQQTAQELVLAQITELAERRVGNGALIALRPNTGEILAMVGSADFYNEDIDGQINMTVRPRQPGSSIKPLTYTTAFEKGWTPATLIWDVPSEFPPSGNPNDPRPPYEPVNYDERFHGPVTARSALANSFNVPAVKTLQFVGIYDDPETVQEEGLISLAQRMGITTLTRDEYGLSLTLGGGEVTLLELTGAYAVFANGGLRVPPVGILQIEDNTGSLIYEYEPLLGEQVIRPEHAYLISSIISDNNARTPAFGPNSLLNLPFPAAAKTGTTNDFRDNWTLGFTPEIAVGVWVGNADYTPMQHTSGLTGAAPIWNQFIQIAVQVITGGQSTPFIPPEGIVDQVICSVSGSEPSEWCPSHRTEIFAADQPPLPKELDLWRKVWVDSYSLELASAECPDFAIDELGLSVSDPWARKWIEETSAGKAWAEEMGFEEDDLFFIPTVSCSSDSPRPILALTDPSEGATLESGPLAIFGRAGATQNFDKWVLHYGRGFNPVSWTRIRNSQTEHKEPDKLIDWDLDEIPNGPITLRLTVYSTDGGKAQVRLHLNINIPTPTPTLTPTPTSTLTPTATVTLTASMMPSDTSTITPTPSSASSPSPTDTPTPTETPP